MILENKKLLAVIVVALFLAIGLTVVYFISRQDEITVDNVFDDNFKPDSETIILNTVKGPININNVFKSSDIVSDEIQSSYVIDEGIEYAAGGGVNQFILTAKNSTGDIYQKESLLLNLLGVSKETACVIPVIEYVTNENKEIVYYRDRLTFCN